MTARGMGAVGFDIWTGHIRHFFLWRTDRTSSEMSFSVRIKTF